MAKVPSEMQLKFKTKFLLKNYEKQTKAYLNQTAAGPKKIACHEQVNSRQTKFLTPINL
jgi:hypothetical protein